MTKANATVRYVVLLEREAEFLAQNSPILVAGRALQTTQHGGSGLRSIQREKRADGRSGNAWIGIIKTVGKRGDQPVRWGTHFSGRQGRVVSSDWCITP